MKIDAIIFSLLPVLIGYLIGSIPTAYLAGKWIKGIDLRKYGSGTVSASMVFEHVARWAVVPVGVFDILKGALAAWLGMQLIDHPSGAAISGIAAVIGHNWPLFLNFTGGRGLSPFMGVLLVVFPLGAIWMLFFLGFGYFLGDSAPWSLISLATLPLLNRWVNGTMIINWCAGAILIVTFVKRLEANRRPLPADAKERRKVILLRLIFDRDIANHEEWIRRTP